MNNKTRKPIRLTLKTNRKHVSWVFPRIERRVKGGDWAGVWLYLRCRDVYTYHAGLGTGQDNGEDAEYWLDRMLSYLTPERLSLLDHLEINW
jgi:hypothetical protein